MREKNVYAFRSQLTLTSYLTAPSQICSPNGYSGGVKMQDMKSSHENAGQMQHNTTHRQFTLKLE